MKTTNTIIYFVFLVLVLLSCNTNTEKSSSLKASAEQELFKLLSAESYGRFPSYNTFYPVPEGAKTFALSQNYPDKYEDENYPWLQIDFKKEGFRYMDSVLKYCMEGNIEVDFLGQYNKTRKWYHSPWLHNDDTFNTAGNYVGSGREYIHGLTMERSSRPGDLHKFQTNGVQNWAVSMYNSPGGYTLGNVWLTESGEPDINKSDFPEGSVGFKLLFTEASLSQVPFLKGSLEWDANIYDNIDSEKVTKRVNKTMRLIQLDIAVRDSRASKTGWVFGTFIYDGASKGKTVWERLIPVGLSWGNDADNTVDLQKDGAFINKSLKESENNPYLLAQIPVNKATVTHFGRGGRTNGPVDNKKSSCISCHGQAANTSAGKGMRLGDFVSPMNNFPIDSLKKYFSNVKPGAFERVFEDEKYITTDYSLQLSAGIRNYKNHQKIINYITSLYEKDKNIIKGTTITTEEYSKMSKSVPQLPRITRVD